jgi:hypothetical protein
MERGYPNRVSVTSHLDASPSHSTIPLLYTPAIHTDYNASLGVSAGQGSSNT